MKKRRIYEDLCFVKFDKRTVTAEEQTAWIEYHYELRGSSESLENIAKYSRLILRTLSGFKWLKKIRGVKDWSGYNVKLKETISI